MSATVGETDRHETIGLGDVRRRSSCLAQAVRRICVLEGGQLNDLAVEDANRLMSLAAWVVLGDGCVGDAKTTAELQAFVKSRLLPFKYPRSVVYLSELPKTGTGKIDRQALKAARPT